jgi:hypothetical protein
MYRLVYTTRIQAVKKVCVLMNAGMAGDQDEATPEGADIEP